MKKLIYLMGMFLLFSTPTLVHAETDLSQISNEEMLQELNERFAEEKASLSVQEPEVKQEEQEEQEVQKIEAKVEIQKADESVEPFDGLKYSRTVEKMSESRIVKLIDNYAEKESLTKIEEEKLSILEDELDGKLSVYRYILYTFLIVLALCFVWYVIFLDRY